VIEDAQGNLFGTASTGGATNAGVVYKIDASGHESVLYSFTNGADGGYPRTGLILDGKGNLYGTTPYGGVGGGGVVFKVDPKGHETVLYTFTGGADGEMPQSGVIRDSAGNLFGTTYGGGSNGLGNVYKLDTAGNLSVLYSFSGPDGQYPASGLARDSAGNFYGTTYYGGSANMGTIYELDESGNETVLYSFQGSTDGGEPLAGVIRDAAGNLYGTTPTGGRQAAGGVVYKLKGK
jgi:uncharacterized repeat protein (TIGR03803 family)